MIKIRLIVVDRTRAPFIQEGESFYLKRLKRYSQVDRVEVKAARITKGRPDAEILSQEENAIARKLETRDYVICMDRKGRARDSKDLAAHMDRLAMLGRPISFVIGGPLGLSGNLVKRADESLSLSKMTLTHEMSRLVLLEQLYRAFTILKNEKYHK
jgi:23S rRNA (pseudouridine1915-N3)-methyltransferase